MKNHYILYLEKLSQNRDLLSHGVHTLLTPEHTHTQVPHTGWREIHQPSATGFNQLPTKT